MNEFLEQFIVEGRELLEQATSDLLELEQNSANRERLDSAFRAFHTLKGAAGIVDFDAMGRALHAAEDALSAVRAGKQAVTADLITRCLTSLDQVSAWLKAIEASGDLPMGAEAAADRIVALFEGAATAAVPPPAETSSVTHAHDLIDAQVLLLETGAETPGRVASALTVAANVLAMSGRIHDADRLRELARSEPAARAALDALAGAKRALTGAAPAEGAADREDTGARAVRVDIGRVDALVKLAGELTTAKNAVGHVLDLANDGADAQTIAARLQEHHASLDRLVGELQRAVLSVRVLPMRQVLQRFPRVVREMSAELGKPARLLTEGEDTEADKGIVEALFEPLLHVVRNALDHGVEDAAQRAALGKPNVASIGVRARRAGDSVVVEVEDDGSGIDVGRVRALAVERGVASAEAVAAMADDEAVELIFTPGFSTAQAVTAISGRGVGMDAVRTAINALGGQVEIENHPGRGTTVRFLLPFTLMMTRVMTVEAGGQAFGLPFDAVIETIRLRRDEIGEIGAARAFVYRERTIPLIDLAASLGRRQVAAASDAVVVVADVGGEPSGFEVERVGEALNVMLSPLEGLLAGARGVAGATLLGDGRVLIVLDLYELAD